MIHFFFRKHCAEKLFQLSHAAGSLDSIHYADGFLRECGHGKRVSSQMNLRKHYDLDFEIFYATSFGHGITPQPDQQYSVNVGGGAFPDALAATIRLSVAS